MRSDDDKTQDQSGSPAGDNTGGWTPADLPEEEPTPPAAAPEPWTPPAAAPEPWTPPAAAPEPWTPPAAAPEPWTPPAAAPEPWTPPAAAPEPWTPPAAAPEPWTPPAAAPEPWTPPAAAPEPSPQSQPAPQGWPPAPAPSWPPAQPNQAWPPNQGWQPTPVWPPYQGWPPAQPNQGWQPNQSWPPALPPAAPNPTWPPAQPPVPPQSGFPAGTDRSLPRRPSRLPQMLMVIAACMISFSAGLVVDHVAFRPATPSTASQPTITTGGSLQGTSLYDEALQVIRQNFVGRSSLTDKQLLYGSIRGLVDSLGDTGHSVFLTPDEYQAFQNSLNATVAGIGVLMSDSSGVLTVNKVVPGSPAAAAGLKPGDQITAVDGAPTAGQTMDQIGPKIRGPEGTTVKITIMRPGSATPLDFTITRAQVAVPLVEWGMVPGTHVADISLVQFDTGAADQLKTAMEQATAAGATAIVLDLRGNPGGYASEATGVASQFLKDGVIYIEQDANGNQNSIKVDTSQPHTSLPLAVLVDHGSASSSEIVAGALQDAGRAKIIGVATFGTGTVLQQFQLSDGSVIILGTKYWLTPAGHKIFGVGITPDQAVAMPNGALPIDPSALGSMTTAQLNSSGDAELLAAVHSLSS